MNQQTRDGSDGGAQVVLAEVREDDLSLDEVVAAVRHPRAGGIATFVGVVREHDQGAAVDALDYSAHPTAPDVLRQVAEEVAGHHAVIAVGRGAPRRAPRGRRPGGGRGGQRRRTAVRRSTACRELIDTLKATRADLEAPAVQRRLRRVGGAAVTDAPGPSTGMSRRTGGWLVALFVGVALAALLSLIHLPYAILKPGPVTNTLGRGQREQAADPGQRRPHLPHLRGARLHHRGRLRRPAAPGQRLGRARGPGRPQRPRRARADDVPQGHDQQAGRGGEHRRDGGLPAGGDRRRAAGHRRPRCPRSSPSPRSPDGSPAKGVLRAGDEVVSVDGVPADSTEAVRGAVQKHSPGETVAMTVRRGGATRRLTARTADAEGKTVLGVLLRTRFDFPVKVSINAGDVGGPSAGMMFSLGHLRQADARAP